MSQSLGKYVHTSHYQVVRAQPTLARALDEQMLPALESDGPIADRVEAYGEAHQVASAQIRASVARGNAAGASSAPNEGPRPGQQLLDSFDRCATDALRVFFDQQIARIEADDGSAAERVAALKALEPIAQGGFPWASGDGPGVVVDLRIAQQRIAGD